MKEKITVFRKFIASLKMPRWARWAFRGVLAIFLFMIVAYVSLAWYINSHRDEVLASVTEKLNEDITGSLEIEGMETTFLGGFPGVSLRLEQVVLKDSLSGRHGKTLLNAGSLDISVNALALMRGTIEIKKITIRDASVQLYTDASGYSNSSVFKKGKSSGGGGGSFPELRGLDLEDVAFTIDNQKKGKLYSFSVRKLKGSLNDTPVGWKAGVSLNALVNSMAFNTQRGSFVKGKEVAGDFDITFNEETGVLVFDKNRLDIGDEKFYIGASIKTASPDADFAINIENKSILWKDAGNLLSPNITGKLEMFDMKRPIAVKCDIIGGFNVEGDPLIRVNAEVKDNVLHTPGGIVEKCSFFGVFTNEYRKGGGYTDANSAIKLFNFRGEYAGMLISMNRVFILDLEKPVAVGDFSSTFEMQKLRSVVDDDLLKFSKGTANVKLGFRADIVDFRLSKPYVKGLVEVRDADVSYVPRKLDFRGVSVALNFTSEDLFISKIVLKTGKSIVNMEGSIKNFLNLYYTDPEKIVITWDVYSPRLNLGEFAGFLGSRKKHAPVKNRKGNMTEDLDILFEKSNVDMKLRVDELYYNRFHASDARADILLTDEGVHIKNAGLRHGGGSIVVNGYLAQSGKTNRYNLDAVISNVDISKFFYAFHNFGMETLSSNNLRGYFSSKAKISGSITDAGGIVPKSMNGNLSFVVNKGRLLDFEPLRNIGKFAFPYRNMENIEFYNLGGRFDVKGEKVSIHPMKISSSAINMDVEGVYSFGKGTEIYVDVPLRNPKRDEGITDKAELAKRRNRGIVLHLKAVDDKDGKVKVKLGGKKD
ncbi:AsmA family protein [Flavobacterium sp. MFBS3-15]|uniref:AsmA family protein n=1 Tax=Flavobacterium sp. MFBS3-15 TaxID=2989816 RepID=UPI002235EB9C|nr:AsmA-like C-terminal region-containing protein [Flavobacterium sp. MFBS3-15]MCW4469949.1 AsmA family protein [Flavobacterium sp. MFBS3-15]